MALAVGGSVMSLFGTALPAQDRQIALVYSTGKSGAELGLLSVFCEPGEEGPVSADDLPNSLDPRGGVATGGFRVPPAGLA